MLNKTLNVPSTMVAARMKSCDVVLVALETNGPQMVDVLGGRFAPHLDDGQVMPFETQLRLFEKELIRLRDQLRETERRNRKQKARENSARRLKDADVKQVNTQVTRVRQILSGAFDDDQLVEAGLARRNARDPEVLQEQAATLVANLGQADQKPEGSQLGQFAIDTPTLAQDLKPSAEQLRHSLSELRREEKQTEKTQIAKSKAMDEFNHGFLWIARSVESNLQLAGLEEEAARVRPSSRRPGVTERLETSDAEGDQPTADDDPLDAAGDQPTADGDSNVAGSEDSSTAPVTVTSPEAS